MDEEILTGRAKQIQDYLNKKLAPFYTKKDPETGEEIPLDYSSPDAPLPKYCFLLWICVKAISLTVLPKSGSLVILLKLPKGSNFSKNCSISTLL